MKEYTCHRCGKAGSGTGVKAMPVTVVHDGGVRNEDRSVLPEGWKYVSYDYDVVGAHYRVVLCDVCGEELVKVVEGYVNGH